MLGKLSQQNDKMESVVLNTQSEIDQILSDPAIEIADFHPIGADLVQLSFKKRGENASIDVKGQAVIGAHVTSYSRIYMHTQLLNIASQKGDILYSDT